jgi:hypothetical protein
MENVFSSKKNPWLPEAGYNAEDTDYQLIANYDIKGYSIKLQTKSC